MTEGTFPRRMALATDLSHRCDRALDRALLVARAWQAELTVIHALAPPETMTLFGSLRDLPSGRQGPRPHLQGSGERGRSEEQPSELQSLMRISYAVFCVKKISKQKRTQLTNIH